MSIAPTSIRQSTAVSQDRRETTIGEAPIDLATAAPELPRDAWRPLRVLLIAEASGGGTGRHVLDLAEGFMARGCEVHLIYSDARIDSLFGARLGFVKGLHQKMIKMQREIGLHDLAAVYEVRRYIKEFGPFHIIHGHASKGSAVARLAGIRTNSKVFSTMHGLVILDPGLSRLKRWMYWSIEWLLSKLTARIIAVSPEEARVARRMGLGRSRVVMVPNGIGPQRLRSRAEARAAIGFGDENIVVGFVGRLVPQKGPDVLVRAFAEAVTSVGKLRLALVGGGPMDSQLRQLAEQFGVADKIAWLGERDARTVLAGFDLFAIASRKEGLPYVVMEAMAARLPVVASQSSGVELLVTPDVNGVVVETNNHLALAKAITRIASNDELRDRFANESARLITQFGLDTMVDRTIINYLQKLRRKGFQPVRVTAVQQSPVAHLDSDDLFSEPVSMS